MKHKFNYDNVIKTLKAALLITLAVVIVVVFAQAFADYMDYEIQWRVTALLVIAVSCIALITLESVNTYQISNFKLKMVFFTIESALLFVICAFTGDSYLAVLYSIILAENYMTINKFSYRSIMFGTSCLLYSVSFALGWVIINGGASLINSIVEVLSGILFGLLIMAIEFIVAQFLIRFYEVNRELLQALDEAEESRQRLEEAQDELARTAVYEERNRIAKDIHDNVGHSITTVIMQTEAAKLLIDTDRDEAKNRIVSANIQARQALEQMRESVHLLAGREGKASLSEEIKAIIAQTIEGTDIKARYDLDEVDVDGETGRYLCNCLKECFANGVRHGKASAFYIELKHENGITLYVSDNGIGVKGEIKEGFGLGGMRRKIEKFGGSCTFSSESGNGFETSIFLPEDKVLKDKNEVEGERQ